MGTKVIANLAPANVWSSKPVPSSPTEFKAPWGEVYGGNEPFETDTGLLVWMCRKRQKVRFYTLDGRQIGPEQANVAPAIAYACAHHWDIGLRISIG